MVFNGSDEGGVQIKVGERKTLVFKQKRGKTDVPAVAPSSLTQKSIFSSEPAVMKIWDALSAFESWIPDIETEEAPACQRIDFPGANPPTR